MKIEITPGQFTIAGTSINFPVTVNELKKILGEARVVKKKYNHVYTWDGPGICGYSDNGKDVQSLTLIIKPMKYDFSPKNTFTGEIRIEEFSHADYYQKHLVRLEKSSKYSDGGTFVVGDTSIYYDVEENEITSVSLTKYVEPPAKVYSDKYRYKKIAGEK